MIQAAGGQGEEIHLPLVQKLTFCPRAPSPLTVKMWVCGAWAISCASLDTNIKVGGPQNKYMRDELAKNRFGELLEGRRMLCFLSPSFWFELSGG